MSNTDSVINESKNFFIMSFIKKNSIGSMKLKSLGVKHMKILFGKEFLSW